MPTISMFYGIIIRMYFAPGEHQPPHFHVYYNESGKQNWYLRGRSCIKKSYWQIGNL